MRTAEVEREHAVPQVTPEELRRLRRGEQEHHLGDQGVIGLVADGRDTLDVDTAQLAGQGEEAQRDHGRHRRDAAQDDRDHLGPSAAPDPPRLAE